MVNVVCSQTGVKHMIIHVLSSASFVYQHMQQPTVVSSLTSTAVTMVTSLSVEIVGRQQLFACNWYNMVLVYK